jgi:SAM-dependent methyltransferase/uncharacterized protein YbaR (Trm112 family)
MKPKLIDYLCCPECQGALSLEDAVADPEQPEEVGRGRLVCAACDARYPIVRGIPRFVPAPEAGVVARTSRRFGNQWRHFRERFEEFREAFLDWMLPLGPDDFRERVVVDAGCGMGRFTEIAASFDAAAVIGVDLSEAVEIAHEGAKKRANAHIVQADLRKLPIKRCVQLVFSLGVLHHIPNGDACLAHVAGRVQPGGLVHVWLYGREGNEWLLRWVDPVRRAITSRLPFPMLWGLSLMAATPLHLLLLLLYRSAGRQDTRQWLPYRPYLVWLAGFPFRHTHQVVFDHLGAPLARYLTHDEVQAWLIGAGLVDLRITARNANSWRGTGRVPARP